MTTTFNSVHFNNDVPATLSLLSGYQFNFQDGDTNVVVNASAWSGKEVVLVDQEEVSSKRNSHKMSTIHDFQANGKSYRVELQITNLFTGEVDCKLFREDCLIGYQHKGFSEKPYTSPKSLFMFGLYFIGVLSLGTLAATSVVSWLASF